MHGVNDIKYVEGIVCVLMRRTISAFTCRHWRIPPKFWDSLACLKTEIATSDLLHMKQDATHTAMTFGGQTSRPNSDPHMLVSPCLQLLNYAYDKENSKSDITVNCYMLSNKGMSYIPYLFYHILTQLLSFHVTKISPFLTHQCYIYIYIYLNWWRSCQNTQPHHKTLTTKTGLRQHYLYTNQLPAI